MNPKWPTGWPNTKPFCRERVRQFVIYLGTNRPKMRTTLRKEEQITGYALKNIHDLPVDKVLDSEIPEEVILSILADYPKANTAAVVQRIIGNLQKLATDEATLNRYIQQLVILSRLRKLDKETEKQVRDMPITYDIKKPIICLTKESNKE